MGRGQKKREGGGEKQKEEERDVNLSLLLPSPSRFFCPRPTFRALSHLSRFDSQRDDLLEEKKRLLAV